MNRYIGFALSITLALSHAAIAEPHRKGTELDAVVELNRSLLTTPTTGTSFSTQSSASSSQPASVAQPLPLYALQPRPGEPLHGLSSSQLLRFNKGKEVFNHVFQVSEGLGPGFNAGSCNDCHNNGGAEVFCSHCSTVFRFGHVDSQGTFDPMISLGGASTQSQSIGWQLNLNPPEICGEVVPNVANGFDPLIAANVESERSVTPIFGAGLVEAIPDRALRTNAVLPPAPDIHGLTHMVLPLEAAVGDPLRVGRFGWKSQLATMLSFAADALKNEHGVTNALLPTENAPQGDAARLALCDTVADPEDLPDQEGFFGIERLDDYQRYLAQPPQMPRKGMVGESLFRNIGCDDCHVQKFVTSDDLSLEPALRRKIVFPYSDFLLHNMGSRGDQIVQGNASKTNMRTAPLWGLSLRVFAAFSSSQVNLYHDHKLYPSLHDAILDHVTPGDIRNEAHRSVYGPYPSYNTLSPADQNLVRNFLMSLGANEYNFDRDNNVDHIDFDNFKQCFQGAQGYSPDHFCAIHDIDADTDVDLDDFAPMPTVYEPYSGVTLTEDCNCNAALDYAGNDMVDILNGAVDVGWPAGDGRPDECRQTLWLVIYPSNFPGADQPSTLRVCGVPNGQQNNVVWRYGTSGYGDGPFLSELGGLCVNMPNPSVIPGVTLGTGGSGCWNYTVPPNTFSSGATVSLQAFFQSSTPSNSLKSDVKTFTIP